MNLCKNLFCCEDGEYSGFCIKHSSRITAEQVLTIVFIVVVFLLFIGLGKLHVEYVQQSQPSAMRASAMKAARDGGLPDGTLICYRISWDINGKPIKACEKLKGGKQS